MHYFNPFPNYQERRSYNRQILEKIGCHMVPSNLSDLEQGVVFGRHLAQHGQNC